MRGKSIWMHWSPGHCVRCPTGTDSRLENVRLPAHSNARMAADFQTESGRWVRHSQTVSSNV